MNLGKPNYLAIAERHICRRDRKKASSKTNFDKIYTYATIIFGNKEGYYAVRNKYWGIFTTRRWQSCCFFLQIYVENTPKVARTIKAPFIFYSPKSATGLHQPIH